MKLHKCIIVLCSLFIFLPCLTTCIKKHRVGLGVPVLMASVPLPEDEWFEQQLDHFDPQSTNTWQQKYNTNSTHFKNGTDSPVFLMIGGEGPASPKWLVNGTWLDYAEKYGALCFQLEHRFYGKSHPTRDMSVQNLKYLSSEQALADLAYFIEGMNEKYGLSSTNKWIAFGGSYPGSLAAWARLKYPHLIHAAVSTSGPLLAKADFREYFDVVRDSLTTYGKNCADAVADANHLLEVLTRSDFGIRTINKMFRLCSPLDVNSTKDVQSLFESLAGNFAGVVQYNKDNRPGSEITIDTLCNIMVNESSGTPVARYGLVNNMMITKEKQLCTDYKYGNMIDQLRKIQWDETTSEGGRQWMYQTCTEFGFYQTASTKSDLFGADFPLEFFEDQCKDIFGKRFTPKRLESDIFRTNTIYGGLNITVERVVFVHGSIDPWHALGITKSISERAPAIFIEGTAHCANMYPSSPNDLPQLKKAREEISTLLGKWLKE